MIKRTPEEQAKQIQNYVGEQIKKIPWLNELEPDVQFIGLGGTFRNLARIVKRLKRYPIDMLHNYHIAKSDFDNVYDMVKVLELDKRSKIKGLNSDSNLWNVLRRLAIYVTLRDAAKLVRHIHLRCADLWCNVSYLYRYTSLLR